MISELLKKAREHESEAERYIDKAERPVFHLSPRAGWMNDPNGFSIYKGTIHQFYQYYPYKTEWGPMHWGHAVSKDYVKWDYLPAAIAPDETYDNFGCFSGGAVETKEGKQLLVYTGVKSEVKEGKEIIRQTQCLAFGDGTDYEKFQQNPVIDHKSIPEGWSPVDFRDPKIWFDEEDDCYYIVAGNRTDDGSGAILLFESKDGKEWKFVTVLDRSRNEYGKMWECPDFFELDGKHFIFTSPQFMQARTLEFHNGNGNIMIVGDYDRKTHSFVRESVSAIDYGLDFYAMQTLKSDDGRRIMTAWMQSWESCKAVPEGQKWFGQMILPRELSFKNGRLYQRPVREIENYRKEHVSYRDVDLFQETTLPGVSGKVCDMELELVPNGQSFSEFKISLHADSDYHTDFIYRPEDGIAIFDRTYSGFPYDINNKRKFPVRYNAGKLKLRILLDRFSAEIFVNDGESTFSSTVYAPEDAGEIRFSSKGSTRMDLDFWALDV